MARRRDFKAEHRRRDQLARERGFRNYSEQRRYERSPRSVDELLALPGRAKGVRSDVARALDLAKAERMDAEAAASRLGVRRSAVTWWGAEALGPTRGGRTSVTQRDIARLRPLVFEGGTQLVAVRGWKRREVERIFDIQWRAQSGGASPDELDWLRGRRFRGRAIVADEATLVELGRRGLVDPGEAYREIEP